MKETLGNGTQSWHECCMSTLPHIWLTDEVRDLPTVLYCLVRTTFLRDNLPSDIIGASIVEDEYKELSSMILC